LRLPGGFQQRAQPRIGSAREEGVSAKAEPESGEHRPTFHAAKRRQRPGQPTRRFAARRVNEAQRIARDEDADADIRFAQQALKALVRACLPFPGWKLIAAIRIEFRMQHDKRLGGHAVRRRVPPKHCHVGRQQRFMLRHRDAQTDIKRWAARAARDISRRPAEYAFEESPWVIELEIPIALAAGVRIKAKPFGGFLRIALRLPDGRQPHLSKDIGANNQPFQLEIVQPFRGFVPARLVGHGLLNSWRAKDRRGPQAPACALAPRTLGALFQARF
jgi:hypothetical protein